MESGSTQSKATKQKNEQRLNEAIISVIAFFDMFDYPLTAFEIWQWLEQKCELEEITKELDSGSLTDIIALQDGFYFLAGRSEILAVRHRRHNYARRKIKRVSQIVCLFKVIPWIRLLAVGNIIGAHNLKDGSDIDLFIVAKKDRVWLTRLFCAGLMKILGRRPTAHDQKDRICLNFYVSDEALDLEGLMLPGGDIYFIHWLACLNPIYDTGGVYDKLIKANSWLKEDLPNWVPIKIPPVVRDVFWLKPFRTVIGLMGIGEKIVRRFEMRIMPVEMKEMMNKDTRVVVSDDIIKLHVKDRREEYSKKHKLSLIKLKNKR